jgi:hypothetical protein
VSSCPQRRDEFASIKRMRRAAGPDPHPDPHPHPPAQARIHPKMETPMPTSRRQFLKTTPLIQVCRQP